VTKRKIIELGYYALKRSLKYDYSHKSQLRL
jgi:hypothetical protein